MGRGSAGAGFDHRIERLNSGPVSGFHSSEEAAPARRRFGGLIRPLLISAVLITLLKVAALHHIGAESYQARLSLAYQGGLGQKAGVVLLWPGPVTRWVYGLLKVP